MLAAVMCLALSAGCAADPDTEPGPSATSTPTTSSPTPTPESSDEPSEEPSESSADPSAGPSVRAGELTATVGETVRSPYFGVTVLEIRHEENDVEGGGVYGARVRVCYTERHPGARPDGSTRTSTAPWTFGWIHADEVWLLDDPPQSTLSDRWAPVYRERRLQVGECNEGWIAVEYHVTAYLALTGVRYAPADFDLSVTWRPE